MFSLPPFGWLASRGPWAAISVHFGPRGALGGLTLLGTLLLRFDALLPRDHILIRFLLPTVVKSYYADV